MTKFSYFFSFLVFYSRPELENVLELLDTFVCKGPFQEVTYFTRLFDWVSSCACLMGGSRSLAQLSEQGWKLLSFSRCQEFSQRPFLAPDWLKES